MWAASRLRIRKNRCERSPRRTYRAFRMILEFFRSLIRKPYLGRSLHGGHELHPLLKAESISLILQSLSSRNRSTSEELEAIQSRPPGFFSSRSNTTRYFRVLSFWGDRAVDEVFGRKECSGRNKSRILDIGSTIFPSYALFSSS